MKPESKAPSFLDTLIAVLTEVAKVIRWMSKDENRVKIHNVLEIYKKIMSIVLTMYQANVGSIVAIAKSTALVLDAANGVKETFKVAVEESSIKTADYNKQMEEAVAELMKAIEAEETKAA